MRQSLADFVRQTREEKGYTLVDVARQSGGQISDGYVSRIENGVILSESISSKKLAALARGLHVSEDIIYSFARGRSVREGDASETQLLTYYRQLPPERQKDVMIIARALHKEHGVRAPEDIRTATKAKRSRAA